MKEKKNTSAESASRVCYETIEASVRSRIRAWLQDLLEAEVTEFWAVASRNARGRSRRRVWATAMGMASRGRLRSPRARSRCAGRG